MTTIVLDSNMQLVQSVLIIKKIYINFTKLQVEYAFTSIEFICNFLCLQKKFLIWFSEFLIIFYLIVLFSY